MQKIQKKNYTKNAFLVKMFKKYFPDTSYGRWDGAALPTSTKKQPRKVTAIINIIF